MLADAHISSLGYLWFYKSPFTVKLTKPWTQEIFMECFCVAKRKPIRHEKPKPQTTRIVSLGFCGLLTCLELHCDWSLHNQLSWNFSAIHGFLRLTVKMLTESVDLTVSLMPFQSPWVGEGSLTNSSMASRNVQLTTLSRTSHANLTWSAKFLGQVIRNKINYTCTIKHHYSVVQVNFVTNR